MPSIEELHTRGLTALNRGRHATARRYLERARAAGASGDRLARIEGSLAYIMSETGQGDRALELCFRALSHVALSDATRGALHGQAGLLLMLRGDGDGAVREFDQAVELLGEDQEHARVRLNRGNVHLQRHALRDAREDFRQAERLYTACGDEYGAAKATHNLGYVALLAGDLTAALAQMDRARDTVAAGGPVMTAMVAQDRAEVLMAAGLVHEGRTALQDAARAYGARRMHQRRGESELALALAELGSDPDAALAAARRARRSFERAHVDAWRVRAEAAALVAEVELGRTGPSLVARGNALASELDGQGLRWRALNVRLRVARVLIRRGELSAAAERMRGLRTDGRAPLASRMLHRDVRAELAAAQGRRANALQHVRAGLADLHAWQSSFGSLDLQTGVVGHGQRLGVRGLALAVDSGRPDVIFEWSERARMLASRVQPVRAPEDDGLVADLGELREIAQARERGRRTSAEREAELRRRVRERAWQHRGSGEVADPVSLEALRAGLGDAGLVAYVVTGDRVVALVTTASSVATVDLGARSALEAVLGGLLPDLDVAAGELPQAMAGFVRTALSDRLRSLAELLVAPVLPVLGDRPVVLTPSGVLAGVPWTLLPGFVGRPVTVAQSATSWLARRTTPLRSGAAGFVAGPRVVRAEDEVTSAAKEWGDASVLAGDGATAAAVSELASRVDVLHVAAHGRHSAENAMFSGLQLADGPWYGYDIDQLRRVPDVVVLSACEVGRSTVRWGEELIGMTTAWLHAGARAVVASAAAVNDVAAYDTLTAVHQQLAAGVDPATALAAAVPAVGTDSAPVPLVCFG